MAKILVVEDECIVAKNIQMILRKMGYEVPATASSGDEAIEKTKEIRPDLVLMDIVLKGRIDGIEAAKEIINRFQTPVVYLTAYSDEDTIRRVRATKPKGYVTKPFRDHELREAVEAALTNLS